MSGRGEPPEGSRGGGPDGEDEFRVVFDESFVHAAVLHEPSAQERLRTGRGPRRLRRILGVPAGTFRLGILIMSVVLVLAGALYLGARRSSTPATRSSSGPAVLVRVSLVPEDGVPVSTGPLGTDPFAGTPSAGWREGRAGITLPDTGATKHFSAPQVRQNLELIRDFVVGTQLDPDVWRGVRPWAVAVTLEADQHNQLIAALDRPADDDEHAATGWVTRFDPTQVVASDTKARVSAVAAVDELEDGELQMTVDGVFVYAVHQLDTQMWTRFAVHRVWDFRVDASDLRHGQFRVRRIVTVAAPQACTDDSSAYFRPMFGTPPGGAPQPPVAARPTPDPFTLGAATGTTCGELTAAV
jgi:hypothetical protein